MVGPEEIIANMVKMQENVVSCVFEPVQIAALDALTGDQSVVDEMVDQYRRRRDLMVNGREDFKVVWLMEKLGLEA